MAGNNVIIYNTSFETAALLQRIADERRRQDAKFGEGRMESDGQCHDILAEELGEAARARMEGNELHADTEMVEAAASIVLWLECRQRRHAAVAEVMEKIESSDNCAACHAPITNGQTFTYRPNEKVHVICPTTAKL